MKTKLIAIASVVTAALGLSSATPASADGGAPSTLLFNQMLFEGQNLVSDSCYYHAEMQTDGNFVIYAGPGSEFPIWSSMNEGMGSGWFGHGYIFYASLQGDGNFVMYQDSPSGQYPMWASNTVTNEATQLWMQNDGNLVVYPATSPGRNALWSTNTARGEYYGPSSCPMRSHVTQVVYNEQMGGGNFASECATAYETCGNLCAQKGSACAGWNWIPGGQYGSCSASVGACYLKSVAGVSWEWAPGQVSGVVEGWTP